MSRTGIEGAIAATTRPPTKANSTGGREARAPNRSTARPAIGIAARVARLEAVNASP